MIRILDLTLTKTKLPQSWLWLRDFFTLRSCTAITDKDLVMNECLSELENIWPVKPKRFLIKNI